MTHLLLFQYGDYGATWRRLAEGLPETYRDQRDSVAFVAALAGRFRVTTLSICDRPHREELMPGLWSVGITPEAAYRPRRVLPLLAGLAPDRMILRTPHRYAMLWARARGVPLLPVFADLFGTASLRQRIENRLTRWGVSGPNVVCVSNHSLNASRSMLTALGLPPERIVPWDQPALPADPDPKPLIPADRPPRAFYAGLVSESKGIGDCLRAAALLQAEGGQNGGLQIDFAGVGDLDGFRRQAAALGLQDRIRFLGNLPNDEVRSRMRAADLVLVPSRHDYAEGLPNTLVEALASRTPVVVSDHPAFASRLRKDHDCLMFPAADPAALAAEIRRLTRDPALQLRLSTHAPDTLRDLRFGLDWFSLMQNYVDDPKSATGWVARNSLKTLLAARGARPPAA